MINSDDSVVITDPKELPNGYIQLIALSWALYDLFLTFDDEIHFVWCRRFRWSSFLFIATRYLTLLMLIMSAIVCTVSGFSHTSCIIFDWFENVGTLTLFALVQIILQMRIYVMYGRSRKILIVNFSLFLLEAAISGIIVASYFRKMTYAIVPASTLGSCFYIAQRRIAAGWAAPLAYEIWLACLALYKLKQEHEVMKALPGTSLITLIVRDNIIYFFMIVAAMIVSVSCVVFTGLNPGVSAITIVHAVGAIGGTRIVLSLLRGTDQPMQLSTIGRVHMPSNFGIGLEFQSQSENVNDGGSSSSRLENIQNARLQEGAAAQFDLEVGRQQSAVRHEHEIKRRPPVAGELLVEKMGMISGSSASTANLEVGSVESMSENTPASTPSPSTGSSSQIALA